MKQGKQSAEQTVYMQVNEPQTDWVELTHSFMPTDYLHTLAISLSSWTEETL